MNPKERHLQEILEAYIRVPKGIADYRDTALGHEARMDSLKRSSTAQTRLNKLLRDAINCPYCKLFPHSEQYENQFDENHHFLGD